MLGSPVEESDTYVYALQAVIDGVLTCDCCGTSAMDEYTCTCQVKGYVGITDKENYSQTDHEIAFGAKQLISISP